MDIYIYNEVIPGDEEKLAEKIKSATDTINVHISSPGGYVYTGWTIGNILRMSGKKTVALIEGFCGSIATYIALSCDEVVMAPTAQFMIHESWLNTQGNKRELKKDIEVLEKIDSECMSLYKEKTGMEDDELKSLMEEEKVMSADEAIKYGFVDAYMEPLKAVAKFENKYMDAQKVEEKLNGIEKILKSIFKKEPSNEAKNMAIELEEGGSVFIEAEDEENVTGSNVFIADENGNATEEPAPDGEHKLKNGKTIVVEGGVIQSVKEEESEVEALKKENEELKSKIQSMEDEGKEKEKESEEKMEATNAAIQALASEIKELKSMTVGTKFKAEKANVQPSGKGKEEKSEDSGLDSFIEKLKLRM